MYFCSLKTKGVSVAQQVEHIPFKDGVLGSSPSWNTKNKGVALQWLLFYVLYDVLKCQMKTAKG